MNDYDYRQQSDGSWLIFRNGVELGRVIETDRYYVANGKNHAFMIDAIETLEGK